MPSPYSKAVRRRHSPLPKAWLFTDERLGGLESGDLLWRAIATLPRGGGIVFRHFSLAPAARRDLALAVSRLAARRHLLLVMADPVPGVPHAGVHSGLRRGLRGRSRRRGTLLTAPAHNARELVAASAAGADLVFLSPVFATRSHPGAPTLGPLRFGLLARSSRIPVVALGGMTPRRARRLVAHGFAGIDCWITEDP